jgi:hypothetical protein
MFTRFFIDISLEELVHSSVIVLEIANAPLNDAFALSVTIVLFRRLQVGFDHLLWVVITHI